MVIVTKFKKNHFSEKITLIWPILCPEMYLVYVEDHVRYQRGKKLQSFKLK